MKLERANACMAQPYKHTDESTRYDYGFKDKILALSTGKVELKNPQVRGLELSKFSRVPKGCFVSPLRCCSSKMIKGKMMNAIYQSQKIVLH